MMVVMIIDSGENEKWKASSHKSTEYVRSLHIFQNTQSSRFFRMAAVTKVYAIQIWITVYILANNNIVTKLNADNKGIR